VRLGKGSFGDVYRCFCLVNQRFFAVKKIFVSYQDQKQYKKKIFEEFNIAKKFNHENIGKTLYLRNLKG
jgi:serine/threonine protein kinase